MPKYETIGGQVTRGETFAKIIWHIDELRECCAVMSHLHQTEGNDMDKLLATGWRAIAEGMIAFRKKIVELAQGRIQ